MQRADGALAIYDPNPDSPSQKGVTLRVVSLRVSSIGLRWLFSLSPKARLFLPPSPLPQLEHLSLGCRPPEPVFSTDDQINLMRECWQKCRLLSLAQGEGLPLSLAPKVSSSMSCLRGSGVACNSCTLPYCPPEGGRDRNRPPHFSCHFWEVRYPRAYDLEDG